MQQRSLRTPGGAAEKKYVIPFTPASCSFSRRTCLRPRCRIVEVSSTRDRPNAPKSATRWPPAPVQVLRERVTFYDRLQGDDFRHPLDQQNTSTLRSIPGLEMIARSFLGPAAEQVLLLENIATSIKVGPDQLPSLYKLLCEAAYVLQMDPPPELYVRQNPVPNAYTLAIAGRQPFIVVHTALLELLTPKELQAVLSHELGHLKCDHGLWLTVANVLASGTVSMLPFFTGMVEEALMRWLRAAELTCDRAALLVAQEPKIVVSALMKLAGGSPSFAAELNVDAFLEQARSYDEATNSIMGWYLRNAQTTALSHPLPVMRAREIDQWAQSAEYKGLLAKNHANKIQRVEFLGPAQAASFGITSSSSFAQTSAAAAAANASGTSYSSQTTSSSSYSSVSDSESSSAPHDSPYESISGALPTRSLLHSHPLDPLQQQRSNKLPVSSKPVGAASWGSSYKQASRQPQQSEQIPLSAYSSSSSPPSSSSSAAGSSGKAPAGRGGESGVGGGGDAPLPASQAAPATPKQASSGGGESFLDAIGLGRFLRFF